MVVGESGLGKSTLVNTLFNTSLYAKKDVPRPEHDRPQTVAIESITADIEENGVRLRLTVVDTPGYGDFINNADGWKPILDNIEARFDSYLEQENRVNRNKTVDNRIHACLYFIEPTGHSLKPVDLEFMRRLHTRVNLIPVIAKADTLTDDEVAQFKARILSDLAHHRIDIYQAPQYDHEDEETLAENEEIVVRPSLSLSLSDCSSVVEQRRRARTDSANPPARSARSRSPSSGPTRSSQRPTGARRAGARTRGARSRSTTRTTATLSSCARCSSAPIWRSSRSTRTTRSTSSTAQRSSSPWASRRTTRSSRRSSASPRPLLARPPRESSP